MSGPYDDRLTTGDERLIAALWFPDYTLDEWGGEDVAVFEQPDGTTRSVIVDPDLATDELGGAW